MSTQICTYNYEYQGQILSPAFSEPASPYSPASSESSDGYMDPLSPITNSYKYTTNCDRQPKSSHKRSHRYVEILARLFHAWISVLIWFSSILQWQCHPRIQKQSTKVRQQIWRNVAASKSRHNSTMWGRQSKTIQRPWHCQGRKTANRIQHCDRIPWRGKSRSLSCQTFHRNQC